MKHYHNVKSYARTPEIQELPSLIDIQLGSFNDFLYGGRLLELFDEINPIQSFNGNLSLFFPGNIRQAKAFDLKYWFEDPKYDEDACLERDMSFAAPLYVRVALVNHEQGDEIIAQDIFLGDFPLMTEKGTFIINGTERVVVSQLIRSPGVYFDAEEERATGRLLSNAKLIPDRGAWMEFETRKTDYITIKFNRKRTIPVTILLRALAAVDDGLGARKSPIKTGEDDEILKLFAHVDTDETHRYIETSFKNEPDWEPKKKQTIAEVALIEFYRRMRPGDPPTLENAREYLESQLFDQRRYDLERVGRYKLNQRLGLEGKIDLDHRTITKADIVALVEQMIMINNGQRGKDDIDHLGNRRVKTVGELIGNKLRIGLRRMERVVKERMSIREAEQLTPVSLVNIRPIVAAVREFFGSSQLSQFMEQTNPLSELTHKRTLSALGPGGLRRERAGFDVRDVHHSHYGRICPIETPEGPNIGLIGRLASYARVNDLGFIETPYRRVVNTLSVDDPRLLGRVLADDVEHRFHVGQGKKLNAELLERLLRYGINEVAVRAVRSTVELKSAKVTAALAGQELASNVEWGTSIPAGTVIDDVVFHELKLSGFAEVDVRWKPPAEKTLATVSEDLKGFVLAEDVAVISSINELVELCRNPELQKSKVAFDALSDRIAGEYAHLDKELFELRLKHATNARDVATRFMEAFESRRLEVEGILTEHIDARRAVVELLTQLQEHQQTSQELRCRAKDYVDSLDRVRELRDDSLRVLQNLANAAIEILKSPGEEVPDNIQSRIGIWGKQVVNLPGRFESLRSTLRTATESLETLKKLDERPIVIQLARLRSESTYRDSEVAFNDFTAKVAREYAHGDNELFALRIKGADKPISVAARFMDAYEQRYAETMQVFDDYINARRPVADLLEQTHEQEIAKHYALGFKRVTEVRDESLGTLTNLHNALRDFMNTSDDGVPIQIRRRISTWGKKLVNLPDQLATLQSSLHKATEAIEGLRDLNDVSIGALKLKEGTILYASAIGTLLQQGITEVHIFEDSAETISAFPINGKILGKALAESIDIHRVLLEEGARLSEEDVALLRQFNIGAVKVVVQNKVSTSTICAIDDSLIGETLAEAIEYERLILEEGAIIDADAIAKLHEAKITEVPVTPFASNAASDIEYLSADKEDEFTIAQANAVLDDKAQFVSNRVSARYKQRFISVPPQRIDYMDIAPRQIVGISAALIPFLSHDAANRALMGSNMQRQAVPLLTPDVSVVSTGMEGQAAYDSGQVLVSDIEAEVISVQGHRVIVRKSDGEELTYQLRKYERSNQSTCIDQRPLVRKGDFIKPGDVIADSSSTYDGLLALGHDVLTCFLSWDGGNYEDALLVSDEMLRKDKFTSIHIEKHEIEARDTKLGPEEITYDIPNVGEDALKDLDEHGIVRIGAEVGPNDILVGKITPKGEKELSPEEKLLRAIFGEQAREVKDSSLRLPHGDRGKVIDVKVFTRDEHPDLPAGVEKMVRVSVAQRRKLTVGDKMAGRHGNKGVISKIVPIEDMPYVEGGVPVEIILNPLGVPSRMNIGQILELHLGWAADRMGFRAITPVFDGVREHEIQAELGRAWMLDWAWKQMTARAWENHERLAEVGGISPDEFDDDLHVICAYLLDRVADTGLYDNDAIILERDEVYVRRVAIAELLRERGHDPDEVMVYDNAELSVEVRDRRDIDALRLSLRLWIEHTAPQGIELEEDLSLRDLFEIANRLMFETGVPVPHYGKQTLYDGRTGEPFDRHVAVGYVHMLKLAHLVEDKAHARSTGPYSLVTQQPLGGKAQFGGQRFGEMEVWALEAYGAAHILQEMLTVKSDDVQGRVKTYESIVKGEPIEEPGIPTSFRVLVKELQSLGLAVEAITGSGHVIRFGKDDEGSRRPQPATGLLGLGSR